MLCVYYATVCVSLICKLSILTDTFGDITHVVHLLDGDKEI